MIFEMCGEERDLKEFQTEKRFLRFFVKKECCEINNSYKRVIKLYLDIE